MASEGDPYPAISLAATLLSAFKTSTAAPMESSHPDLGGHGIKKSQPSSIDSIQQAPGSALGWRVTGVTEAVREPKAWSTVPTGRGREATMVQRPCPAAGSEGRIARSSASSETTRAECSTATGCAPGPQATTRLVMRGRFANSA